MNTNDSERLLKEKLLAKGFNKDNMDLELAVSIFKEFFNTKFKCEDDAILWETGTFSFTGEKLFSCSLVRQFDFEIDDEYDHMEQLHLIIYYEPNEELNNLGKTIWTYDYDEDIDKFFEAVKNDKSYLIPLTKYKPINFEVYFELV